MRPWGVLQTILSPPAGLGFWWKLMLEVPGAVEWRVTRWWVAGSSQVVGGWSWARVGRERRARVRRRRWRMRGL
jgi:hypothetical protein